MNIAKLLRTAIFEKHLQTAASAHFKIKRHIQQPIKYLRYFCQKLVGRCLAGFRVHGKKTVKVLSFLLPLIKFVKLVSKSNMKAFAPQHIFTPRLTFR